MIEGRIIRIFDEYTVALNIGRNRGVERGMLFAIYTPEENIVDPQSGAVLGTTRRRKAVVEASTVESLFTIAVARTRSVRVGGAAALGVFQGTTEQRQESLPVAHGELQPYETGTQIRVGDRVEQVVVRNQNPSASG